MKLLPLFTPFFIMSNPGLAGSVELSDILLVTLGVFGLMLILACTGALLSYLSNKAQEKD